MPTRYVGSNDALDVNGDVISYIPNSIKPVHHVIFSSEMPNGFSNTE